MKQVQKSLALILAVCMLVSMIPAAGAANTAGGGPDDFLLDVSLPLMPGRVSGLYDDPEYPLPAADGNFVLEVEGWTPTALSSGVPVTPGDPDSTATVITDAAGLQAMTAGRYVLGADLDLTDVVWNPIELSSGSSHVVLDGQGHTISGLHIDMTGRTKNGGLFGEVGGSLTVKNLRLEDCSMNTAAASAVSHGILAGSVGGDVHLENLAADGLSVLLDCTKISSVGGLIGEVSKSAVLCDISVDSKITRSEELRGSNVELSSNAKIGGVIGRLGYNADAKRCYVKTEIDSFDANCAAGGMLGEVGGLTRNFRDCMLEVSIDARETCGGLAGKNTVGYSGKKTCRLENCMVSGDLSARNHVGGYFGDVSNSNSPEFYACTYRGTITLKEGSTVSSTAVAAAGGLVGQCGYADVTAQRCAVDLTWKADCADSTDATVEGGVGGVLGYGAGGCNLYVTGCRFDLSVRNQRVEKAYVGGVCGKHFASGGYADVRDSFAEVEVSLISDSQPSLAGMISYIGRADFVNCGADVNLKAQSKGASHMMAAGLCQETDSYATFAKCYTTGSITLSKADTPEEGEGVAAGLGHTGQVSQCWSDVSITVSGGGAKIGGLLIENNGRPLISSWSGSILQASTAGAADIGGLIQWNNNASVTDCCFRGAISASVGNTGAVGGIAARGSGTFRNCYARANLDGGGWIGGILGGDYVASATNIYDCRFEGKIRHASGGAAGILTYGNGGTVARCEADVDIYCPDVSVGGIIAGDYGGSRIRGCSVTGSIMGRMVGGIAGSCYLLDIYDCSVSADLDVAVTDVSNGNMTSLERGVGGVAYAAAYVSNCHVRRHLNVSDSTGRVNAGGVQATVVTPYPGTAHIIGCTSRGITCSSTGSGDLGGIAGDGNFLISDCRVEGDVRLTVFGNGGSAGGIAGYTGQPIYDCSVKGDVSVYVSAPEEYTGAPSVSAGGIAGRMADGQNAILSRSYHIGSVSAGGSSTNPPVIHTRHPLVGYGGNITDHDYTPGEGEKEEENLLVRTFWHEETDTVMRPLEGVTVSVRGREMGVTDESGTLCLSSEGLEDKGLVIFAEKDGYRGTEKEVWFADGGVLNLYLMKKTPGKIYLKAARIYDGEGDADELLYTNHTETIQEGNMTQRKMYFEVDWNDLQEEGRVLRLANEDDTASVNVEAGVMQYINLNEYFDVNDKIWLKASAFDAEGVQQTAQARLGLDIQAFKLPNFSADTADIPLGDNGNIRGIDFLNGLDIGVKGSFNDAIAEFSFVNNQLKVRFGGGVETPKLTFLNTKVGLSVTGEATAVMGPDAQSLRDAIWSGGLNVEFGLDPALDYSMSAPPLAFSTEIVVTAAAGLEVGGSFSNPSVTGTYGGGGELDIVAGPGIGFSDWRVIAGPNVGASVDYKTGLTAHDATAEEIDEVAIEGDASFALEIKGGEFFEFQPGYQIGRFKWTNTEGMKVYAFGIELNSLDEAAALNWVPSTRGYLSEGGGFVGVETMPAQAALNGWAAGGEGERTVYENIALSSRADLTVENGVPVLWFTADDESAGTQGTVADHTVLWRSVQDETGSWGAPEQVETAGYADNLDADGPFAVWIESDQTDTLAGMLTSTDIVVSANGETKQLTNGEGHVFGAQVSGSANGNTAQVIWFSDSSVDGTENLTPQNPTLHYAQYNGSGWSGVRTVNTGGKQVVAAAPCEDKDHIYWLDRDGALHICKLYSYASSEEWLNGLGRTVHDGEYTASVMKNSVCVWQNTALQTTLDINPADMCLIQQGDDCWLVWSERRGIRYAGKKDNWAVKTLVETDGQPMDLSAAAVDGRPVVSYFLSDLGADGKRLIKHLCTAVAPDLSGVDLAVGGLTLNDADAGESGLLRLSAEVTNLRTDAVTEYTYTVTDETGRELYSGTETDLNLTYGQTDSCFAVFAADLAARHTYTLTVTGTGDADVSNNASSAGTQALPKLVDTGFPVLPSGLTGLEAVVSNAGSAPADSMTVEIFRARADGSTVGEALVCENFENVPAGSYRQVMLERTDSHQIYKVVLTSGDAVVDTEMLMWKDGEAEGLWVGEVTVDGQGRADVNLFAQNWTKDVQLYLALYRDGQMVANAVKSLQALEGSSTVSLALGETLQSGTYTGSVFMLTPDSFAPAVEKTPFSVNIP